MLGNVSLEEGLTCNSHVGNIRFTRATHLMSDRRSLTLTEGKAMSMYGVPILGIDTVWTEAAEGAVDPYVMVYVGTPDGERRVRAARSEDGQGIDWEVRGKWSLLDARGHLPEPGGVVKQGVADLAFMESVFDVACAAFYGDYESLWGKVESWV